MVSTVIHAFFKIHVDKHVAANEFSRYRARPSNRRLDRVISLSNLTHTILISHYLIVIFIQRLSSTCRFGLLSNVMLDDKNLWRHVNIVKKNLSRFY